MDFSRRWSSSSLSGPSKIATFEGMRRRCVFFYFLYDSVASVALADRFIRVLTLLCVYPRRSGNSKISRQAQNRQLL